MHIYIDYIRLFSTQISVKKFYWIQGGMCQALSLSLSKRKTCDSSCRLAVRLEIINAGLFLLAGSHGRTLDSRIFIN